MRIKAVSYEYLSKVRRIYRVMLFCFIIAACFYIGSWVWLIALQSDLPLMPSMFFIIFVFYHIIYLIHLFFHHYKRSLCRIGNERFITFSEQGLTLEDMDNATPIEITHSWCDVECIQIKNVIPLKIFRKKQAFIVSFILNTTAYNEMTCKWWQPHLLRKNRLKHLDVFFEMMQTPDVMAAIKAHWHGEVETVDR